MTFSRLLKQFAESSSPKTKEEDIKDKETVLNDANNILLEMQRNLSEKDAALSYLDLQCELLRGEILLINLSGYLKTKPAEHYQQLQDKLKEVDKNYASVVRSVDHLFQHRSEVVDRSHVPEWKFVENPMRCTKS